MVVESASDNEQLNPVREFATDLRFDLRSLKPAGFADRQTIERRVKLHASHLRKNRNSDRHYPGAHHVPDAGSRLKATQDPDTVAPTREGCPTTDPDRPRHDRQTLISSRCPIFTERLRAGDTHTTIRGRPALRSVSVIPWM